MENRKEKPWMEVKELTHSFGEKKVLDHISFQIGKGKMIGLLGPSGAGKTTLVNILTGQLKPDGGTVRLTGESNRKAETYTAGIMMDSFGLYERLSVWDNMKLFARIYGVRLNGSVSCLTGQVFGRHGRRRWAGCPRECAAG